MQLSRIAQFCRCVRPIPRRQLLRRLYLTLKRRIRCRLPTRPLPDLPDCPSLSASLPQSFCGPHGRCARQIDDCWWVTQLGHAIALKTPIDWQDPQVHKFTVCDNGEAKIEEASRPANHLERLTLHYHEFLPQLPRSHATAVALDWIKQNRLGRAGYWLDAWNSYAISIRVTVWLQWLAELQNTDQSFAPDTERRLIQSLTEQLRFLTRNLETDICGNHLIKNLRCLIWAGQCFDGKEAERWYRLGVRLLHHEIEHQLRDDGMHYELSPAYHSQVLGDLLDVVPFLAPEDQTRIVDRLSDAINALAMLTHPDGRISLMSDGGLQMVHPPGILIQQWEALRETDRETRQVNAPERLASTGYFRWENEDQWLLVDCGAICTPELPAHGHADALSFEWDVAGQRLVVDAGVDEYQDGNARRLNRSSSRHNTVFIEGYDQAELIGSFRTGKSAEVSLRSYCANRERFELTGCCQGHVATATTNADGQKTTVADILHVRTFVAEENRLSIQDEVHGVAPGRVARAGFLLHDAWTVESSEAQELVLGSQGRRVVFRADRAIRLEESFWSPDIGHRVATKRIVCDLGTLPCRASYEFEILRGA